MIIFFDVGFLAILAFFILGGTALSVAEWILNNTLLLFVILAIKSLIFVGAYMEPFSKNKSAIERIKFLFAVLIDILRSGMILWCVTDGISTMFNGGIFHMLITGFGLIIGCAIMFFASNFPLLIDMDISLVTEIISTILIAIWMVVLYCFFGGW